MFQKVLIANRGEIAVRIARTLREMGIRSVAVYSDVDRNAPHVRACDEAYGIGPGPAPQSYLDHEKILQVARASGAEAIHPGYGFLSENAVFAEKVAQANLVFIGPPPAAMRVMGSKTGARDAMKKAGVPCVPGSEGALSSVDEAQTLAQKMGFPVMLKASAGGGGKGMRLVHTQEDLATAMRLAASEAKNAFGDATMYMEKAIIKPHHIEIQIFSDADGQTFFIGERECSMQRRHQKVIEEAPSPILDGAMRQSMGKVACQAAQAVQYRGAGTVEFLVDDARNFYFLEMNTRLQVEHPVTELCYGVDLVEAQVKVAAGISLGWRQEQFVPRGHAIEARLYAENPDQNFMPSPGRIDELVLPHGPGLRIDCGVATCFEVPRFYDAMIAKVIAWGESRDAARKRLAIALDQTVVKGIVTNIAFLRHLVRTEAFAQGNYHTSTIAEVQSAPANVQSPALVDVATAAVAIDFFRQGERAARPVAIPKVASSGWRATTWRQRGG